MKKKKIILCILAYFAIGYGVVMLMYLNSHPWYLQKGKILELARDTMINDQFWLAVLIWPVALYSYLKVTGL